MKERGRGKRMKNRRRRIKEREVEEQRVLECLGRRRKRKKR